MIIQSYKDLIVWQKSIVLVKIVYKITDNFDRSDLYGLTSQTRRSAVSIPSNIAEGSRRRSLAEYIRFLSIANGSAAELETQLIIAREIYSNVNFNEAFCLLEEVLKMLNTMIGKLVNRNTIT
jgi:four helix bundle protein